MKNFFKLSSIFVALYWIGIFLVLFLFEIDDSIWSLEDLLFLILILAIPLLYFAFLRMLPLIRRVKYKDLEVQMDKKVEKVEDRIDEERKRLDQITNSHKSTVHSLAGLVITDPWKNEIYNTYISKRLKKNIIIGCQEYTEQLLLSAIIARLLKERSNNTLNVLPKYDFGGVNLNFIALSRGDIDIYPAYTWQGFEIAFSTSLLQLSHVLRGLSPDEAIDELNKIFKPLKHPLQWICYLGYYNNFEIVMHSKLAEKFRIKKISDLRKYPKKFTMGCEPDFFGRPNGYELLKSETGYGLKFVDVKYDDHEDIYRSLENKQVDIVDGFTTDPQLDPDTTEYVKLEDDFSTGEGEEGVFGKYYSSIMIRSRLNDDHPEIAEILRSLENQINENEMREMIREADLVMENQIPRIEKIAETFLEKKELI